MSKRAVRPASRADDRRRRGAGDNVAFTVRDAKGGLGSGKRTTTLSGRTLAKHQFTNRVARSTRNGVGKKTII